MEIDIHFLKVKSILVFFLNVLEVDLHHSGIAKIPIGSLAQSFRAAWSYRQAGENRGNCGCSVYSIILPLL